MKRITIVGFTAYLIKKDINLKKISNFVIEQNVTMLNDFVKAIDRDSYFIICDKYPTRVDKGRHYFSIWFVDDDYNIRRFWPGDDILAKKLYGMGIFKNRKDLYYYEFYSGTICMDRVLDATGKLSYVLNDLFGIDIQFTNSKIL